MLLKKSEIDAMQGEHKTHFLNANAQRLNKSLGDATGMKSIGIHLTGSEPLQCLVVGNRLNADVTKVK